MRRYNVKLCRLTNGEGRNMLTSLVCYVCLSVHLMPDKRGTAVCGLLQFDKFLLHEKQSNKRSLSRAAACRKGATSWHIGALQAYLGLWIDTMLNATDNNLGCQPQKQHIFIPYFLGVSFLFGFILNSLSLWIFWFRMKRWKTATILQFNLAMSDAIVTPGAALILVYSATDDWTFGTLLCQLTVFLLSTNMYGSIYFLALISVHRYYTIIHNAKRTVVTNSSFVKKVCMAVWGCLVIQGIPFFFLLKTSVIRGATKCLNIHQTEMALLFFVWNWVILFSGLLVPFVITVVCYALLIRFILKMNPVNTVSKAMKSKSIQSIGVSLVIFIICYVPVHITRTVAVTIKMFFPTYCRLLETVEIIYYITWTFTGTNCCLDPILYCFASERFNYIFREYFHCFSCVPRRCSRGTGTTVQNVQPVETGSGTTSENSHRSPIVTWIPATEVAMP
ncbi:P2Y purinoceptor 2-like [Ambystoma mexicanum]|uniref:P2Y purinoceptor 2-like n=1 Tax=Ambystoma mexicanum TaxID=8296 RepID=UPI0037E7F37C